MWIDWLISVALYLSAFFLNLSHWAIISDRLWEYKYYLAAIQGTNFSFNDSLVTSSLTTIWLPAQLQKLTGWNELLVFQLPPSLFFALMPMFVYLLSRKYFGRWYSLLAVAIILASFYFTFNDFHSRVDIAWGFLAGVIWAIVSRHYKLSILFLLVLTISHYGTAFITLYVLGFSLVCLMVGYYIPWFVIWRSGMLKDIKIVVIALMCLSVFVGAWYFGVAGSTGFKAVSFTKESIMLNSPTLESPFFVGTESSNQTATVEKKFKENVEAGRTSSNIFMLESREAVVQAAFGKTFPYMNAPQRIEFISSWLVVMFLTLGLAIAIKKRLFTPAHIAIAVGMYLCILATIILPSLSTGYGVVRVYFTACTALAPCYVVPATSITNKRWRMLMMVVLVLVVIAYGLCTSGIMHSFWGIAK